jgi:hypothetical protein
MKWDGVRDVGNIRPGLSVGDLRHADEAQVEVTLTKRFWAAKYETTQGQWKRVMDKLPRRATVESPEDDDRPVGDVTFAHAEACCAKLTELGNKDGLAPLSPSVSTPCPIPSAWRTGSRGTTPTRRSRLVIRGESPDAGGHRDRVPQPLCSREGDGHAIHWCDPAVSPKMARPVSGRNPFAGTWSGGGVGRAEAT